ncbi:hypothetical protein PSQ39_06470 [Curvibacter sp. HBC28]|uniref:Uncharacterized protein n=1 Tax=Curvibacter microcysteis TaxID=3026419 RepID=A0ABT5MD15_9BURK|nr:hypothetical protein [Curvibacter sp. HBC28]MDD0814270.1 hypothetical protein [Curvibacter sp. HBC28]
MNEPTTLKANEPMLDQPSAGFRAHVLLWSQSQCALHIEPVSEMLSSNRRAYAENRTMDYVPIFFGTDEKCHEIGRALRGTMSDRQHGKDKPVGMADLGLEG